MRRTLFLMLALLPFINAFGQAKKAAPPSKPVYGENAGFYYTKDHSWGFRFKNNGWSYFQQNAKIVAERKRRFVEYEFGRIKHEKETRMSSFFTGGITTKPKAYVFGKQYSLYNFDVRWGNAHLLGYKANRNGVSLWVNYAAGPSLALLKPYQLILFYPDSNSTNGITSANLVTTAYNESVADHFLDPNFIYGAAGFWKGWAIKPVPGISARIGFQVDFSSAPDGINLVEFGVENHTYFWATPLMASGPNHQSWTSIYLSFQFGSKK
jgi:hypothetical protein